MSTEAPAATGVPTKGITLAIACPEPSTGKKILRALGIAAIIVVALIIIVIVASMAMLARLFGEAIGKVENTVPPFLCTLWLDRRQKAYIGTPGPDGRPYTRCAAAQKAVADSLRSGGETGCRQALDEGDPSEPTVYDHFLGAHC